MISASIRMGRGPGVVAAGVFWLLMLGAGLIFWWLDIPVEGRLLQAYWTIAAVMVVVFLVAVFGILQLRGHSRVARWGLRAFLTGGTLGGTGVVMMVVDLPGWALLGPAFIVAVGGWIAFAVANLRVPALPRWNGLPLVVGSVPVVFTMFEYMDLGLWVLPAGLGAFGVSWLLLAYAVWAPRDGGDGDVAGRKRSWPSTGG